MLLPQVKPKVVRLNLKGREDCPPTSYVSRARFVLNVLFVCSENRLRSPTAHAVFAQHPGLRSMSAGLNNDADTPISGDLIEWADLILVMEAGHRRRLTKRFGTLLRGKRVAVLSIPDRFEFMDPELVAILRARVPRYL